MRWNLPVSDRVNQYFGSSPFGRLGYFMPHRDIVSLRTKRKLNVSNYLIPKQAQALKENPFKASPGFEAASIYYLLFLSQT